MLRPTWWVTANSLRTSEVVRVAGQQPQAIQDVADHTACQSGALEEQTEQEQQQDHLGITPTTAPDTLRAAPTQPVENGTK
jgi:hypothetical protein